MDVIFLAFISATGMLLVCIKALGFQRTLRWQVWIDVIVTFGLPFAFYGTYHGMATAMIAGVILTLELALLSSVVAFLRPI